MRKILKQIKPTKAEYFKSESQRKRTNRLAFITGSKQLIAIITVLVVASIGTGVYITQKQKDSKAAIRTAVNFNDKSTQVDRGRWQPFENVPGGNNGLFDKPNLSLTFKNTYGYTQGYALCYVMNPEGSAAYPNLTYTGTTINYTSTERGSTKASIRGGNLLNVLAESNPAQHSGGAVANKSLTANLNGLAPGSPVYFCLEKTSAGNNRFQFPINATITNYTFAGAYDKAEAPITPVTPPPPTAGPGSPPPSEPAIPAGQVIDSNRWSGWGFPLPANPPTNHTIEHSNNGRLTINYLTYNYTNGITGCWTTVVNSGNTANGITLALASNDAGKNTVILRATGNNDYIVKRATNGNISWTFTNPVATGGSISICNKVNNTDKKPFAEKKTLTVSSYKIYGTGAANNDSTAPSVSITSPANGTNVRGTINLAATANDQSGIEYVEFKNEANSSVIGTTRNSPYSVALDTTKFPDGDFRFSALARDKKGNFKTSTPITIKIANKEKAADKPDPKPQPNDSNRLQNSPINCSAIRTSEGEQGVRSGSVTSLNDPANSGVTAAVLSSPNAYVECRLTAPETGLYSFGGNVRSGDLNGVVAQAKITARGVGSEATRTVGTPGKEQYGVIRFNQQEDYRRLNEKQSIIVRISLNNYEKNSNNAERKLWVDQLSMYKIPEPPEQNTGQNQEGTAPAKALTCESKAVAEAESGVSGGTTAIFVSDPISPEVGGMILARNASYVECSLIVPKTGRYALGAKVRSQDYKGIAQAKLDLTGIDKSASRTVSAPKGERYGLVRFNEKDDYRQLDAETRVTARVTFTNDSWGGNDKDRNLWVDSIMLVEIPAEPVRPAVPGSGPGDNDNQRDSQPEEVITPCEQLGKVEAEDATLSRGASLQPDSNASGNMAVRLAKNASYVQCTLTAPTKDRYVLSTVSRSDNRAGQDRATARISMRGNDKGTQSSTVISAANYSRLRMPVKSETVRVMEANEQVVVRVELINGSDNILTKRNLLVDTIELVKVPSQPASTPPRNPVNPQTERIIIPSQEGEPGAEQISYSQATGAAIITIQAENARYQGVAFDENPTTEVSAGNKAVRLFANKNYVEYKINFPATDTYSLDFNGRSENYEGKTANARVLLNGNRVLGKDTALKSSPKHNYYPAEKKVLIPKGTHTFRVEFTNDNQDRNLIIDYLRVRGTKRLIPAIAPVQPPAGERETPVSPVIDSFGPNTQLIEAENAQTCQATGRKVSCSSLAVTDPLAYGSQALVLNKTNDYVEATFRTTAKGTYAIGATLRSVDYSGAAQADIFIGRDKIGSLITPSSEGYAPARMYARKLDANTNYKIRVVFKNDRCGTSRSTCRPTQDRNLLVDHFRLRPIDLVASVPASEVSVEPARSLQPQWARSSKNNVLATEWACSPPSLSVVGLFYCPAAPNRKESDRKEGVMLISYTANGGRMSQALVYIPKSMIAELKAGKKVTPRPLVYYLHGRGNAEFVDANRDAISPLGVNRPASVARGYWYDNEQDGRLEAAYNTANDPKYGGVILVSPLGQGRIIDERSWGYPANIADFAKLPTLLEESFSYLAIDRSRIYTMGSSMGGHESLKLVTQYPSLISAAYSNDGVSDWALRYRQIANTPVVPAKLAERPYAISDLKLTIPLETGGTPEQNPQAYIDRSPLQQLNAESAKRPIKIAVDYGDILVDPSQSTLFWNKYKSLNPSAPRMDETNGAHSAQLPANGGALKKYSRPMDFFFNNGNWLRK